MEQIVIWIKTIFKGSNDIGANFSVPVQVKTSLKDKEQRNKFSVWFLH